MELRDEIATILFNSTDFHARGWAEAQADEILAIPELADALARNRPLDVDAWRFTYIPPGFSGW